MKVTTGQVKNYTKECLLDYNYIKNHCRLIAVDLSQQKEIDANPRTIQQIEFVEKLKLTDGLNADGTESMFVLTILEKNQREKTKISSR